jgi:hypothetical protein
MTRTPARMVLALALLATALLGCRNEEVVKGKGALSPSPIPSPSVPTEASLLRYVSPDGDDDNPGTLDRPWGTLAHAFRRLYLGQVLFVRGGVYHEQIDHLQLHPGTPAAPITVLAYPGENPVLAGTVSLRRPTYWLIDNLDVTGDRSAKGQSPYMVKVIGGHAWTWQDSEFSGTLGKANVMITGAGLGEPSGFQFRGNCIHGLPKPPMRSTNLFLGAMERGAHGVVARNVIFNADGQANVRIGSGAGTPVRVKIVRNTVYGGSLGVDVRGRPRDVKIVRNVIGGSTAPAMIRLHPVRLPGDAELTKRDTQVSNNVAVDAAQLLRPEVRKTLESSEHGYGNVVLTQDPEFSDTTRCDGFHARLDAMIPYGAFAP